MNIHIPNIATFTKRAGDPVLTSEEDPSMVLIGDCTPDWVRLPPALGGERRNVKGTEVVGCPCGGSHEVIELDLGDTLRVAECPLRGFLWYRRRTE